ncbi:MAG: hypothetical protein ACI8UR_000002 [Natronomonas sp.]|jgi:hypothetical protein|uniref:hypothetical protein n=1 Tax=Natronomonas sp. TaxID=2184060 RepID=UPI00398986E5
MPVKESGRGTFNEIDAFDGGVGWIAHPDETMERASHALVDGDDVWLVDPVDAEGVDEHLAEYGDVAGVVVLYNYHRRDAADIAKRHDVPVSLPEGMTALSDADVSAPVERIDEELGETGYYLREVTHTGFWQEWALFDGETLVTAESIGAASYFLAPGERLGVTLIRRAFPPKSPLDELQPERVLCGHGEGVSTDAAGELHRALRTARRTAPRMYLRHAPTLARSMVAAALR